MIRRYRFKMKPSRAQAARLDAIRLLHQRLYNAALEERIDCYAKTGKTLSAFDQSKSVTVIRRDDPDYAALSFDSAALTVKRLDQAFKHFFRRAATGAGKSSGFPKFKAARFYPGFDCRENGKGWKMEPVGKRWRARFKGLGAGTGDWIRARGRFPAAPKEIRGCTVTLEAGVWWLSVIVEIERERRCGFGAARLDWDLTGFVVKTAEGSHGPSASAGIDSLKSGFQQSSQRVVAASPADTPNLRGERGHGSTARLRPGPADTPNLRGERGYKTAWFMTHRPADTPNLRGERGYCVVGCCPAGPADAPNLVAALQRKIERGVKGSKRRQRLGRQKTRIQAKMARRRREALHRYTTALVTRFAAIEMPAPDLAEITRSGAGNTRNWGALVDLKALFNRAILDLSPGTVAAMIDYKMTEAGGAFDVIPDPDHATMIGNTLVAAAIENRKLKRSSSHHE